MRYKFILLMFCMIFLVATISAEDFIYQQNTEVNITIVCLNNGYCSSSAFCNATITDPDGDKILDNVQATQAPSLANYNITLNSSQTSRLGDYHVIGFCKDGGVSKEINFPFTISKDGTKLSIQDSVVRIFLIIFFLLLFIGYYNLNDKIDYEKWYEGLVKKYKNRNYVKLVLSSIGFNLIRNKISNYYFIILPIMMLITDIALIYNITTLSLLFENLLWVYMLGILIVAFLFFGQFQEFIVKLFDDVDKESWGMRE